EGLQTFLDRGPSLLDPAGLALSRLLARLVAVVVEGKNLALGRDDPQPLRPVLLAEHGLEELAAVVFRHAVGVEGEGDHGLGDAADDLLVIQRARTEPGGVASATFQRQAVAAAAARRPEEDRPVLGPGDGDRLVGLDDPRQALPANFVRRRPN